MKTAVTGYVIATLTDSSPIWIGENVNGWVFEQIQPGVLEEALQAREVPVLLNHDPSRQLGSSRSGFDFGEDQIGLRVHSGIIQDPEVVQKAEVGKLRGWSFAFKDIKADYELVKLSKKNQERIGKDVRLRRIIKSLTLLEISLIDDVKKPVYPHTLVELVPGVNGPFRESVLSQIETRQRINRVKYLFS